MSSSSKLKPETILKNRKKTDHDTLVEAMREAAAADVDCVRGMADAPSSSSSSDDNIYRGGKKRVRDPRDVLLMAAGDREAVISSVLAYDMRQLSIETTERQQVEQHQRSLAKHARADAADKCRTGLAGGDSTRPTPLLPFCPTARRDVTLLDSASEQASNLLPLVRSRQVYVMTLKMNTAAANDFRQSVFDVEVSKEDRDWIMQQAEKQCSKHTDANGVLHVAIDPTLEIEDAWALAYHDRFSTHMGRVTHLDARNFNKIRASKDYEKAKAYLSNRPDGDIVERINSAVERERVLDRKHHNEMSLKKRAASRSSASSSSSSSSTPSSSPALDSIESDDEPMQVDDQADSGMMYDDDNDGGSGDDGGIAHDDDDRIDKDEGEEEWHPSTAAQTTGVSSRVMAPAPFVSKANKRSSRDSSPTADPQRASGDPKKPKTAATRTKPVRLSSAKPASSIALPGDPPPNGPWLEASRAVVSAHSDHPMWERSQALMVLFVQKMPACGWVKLWLTDELSVDLPLEATSWPFAVNKDDHTVEWEVTYEGSLYEMVLCFADDDEERHMIDELRSAIVALQPRVASSSDAAEVGSHQSAPAAAAAAVQPQRVLTPIEVDDMREQAEYEREKLREYISYVDGSKYVREPCEPRTTTSTGGPKRWTRAERDLVLRAICKERGVAPPMQSDMEKSADAKAAFDLMQKTVHVVVTDEMIAFIKNFPKPASAVIAPTVAAAPRLPAAPKAVSTPPAAPKAAPKAASTPAEEKKIVASSPAPAPVPLAPAAAASSSSSVADAAPPSSQSSLVSAASKPRSTISSSRSISRGSQEPDIDDIRKRVMAKYINPQSATSLTEVLNILKLPPTTPWSVISARMAAKLRTKFPPATTRDQYINFASCTEAVNLLLTAESIESMTTHGPLDRIDALPVATRIRVRGYCLQQRPDAQKVLLAHDATSPHDVEKTYKMTRRWLVGQVPLADRLSLDKSVTVTVLLAKIAVYVIERMPMFDLRWVAFNDRLINRHAVDAHNYIDASDEKSE